MSSHPLNDYKGRKKWVSGEMTCRWLWYFTSDSSNEAPLGLHWGFGLLFALRKIIHWHFLRKAVQTEFPIVIFFCYEFLSLLVEVGVCFFWYSSYSLGRHLGSKTSLQRERTLGAKLEINGMFSSRWQTEPLTLELLLPKPHWNNNFEETKEKEIMAGRSTV